jgi:hypothetical protein
MKKAVTNISASVLARLSNLAKKERLEFNVILLRYAQERFLGRMAHSTYADRFVLKGGLLLLIYDSHLARPTKDIDLGKNMFPTTGWTSNTSSEKLNW